MGGIGDEHDETAPAMPHRDSVEKSDQIRGGSPGDEPAGIRPRALGAGQLLEEVGELSQQGLGVLRAGPRRTRDPAGGVGGHERDRIAPHACQIGEDLGNRQSELALVLTGRRLRRHGAPRVDRQHEGEIGLPLIALDDGLADARRGLPVDVAHIVPGPVQRQIVEILAVPQEHRLVAPVQQTGGAPQRGQRQPTAHARHPGAAPHGWRGRRVRSLRRGLRTGRLHHRDRCNRSPAPSQGVGTAAKIASMIASGAMSSARAS